MPKVNFGVGHKVFDELPNGKDMFMLLRIEKIPKQPRNVKDIKKLKLNDVNEYAKVVEASLTKNKILRQHDDLIADVTAIFEWKPGLKLCSFEKWRKNQHGLNEHGVVQMIKTRSLVLRAELHRKYDNGSLKWRYRGRKFRSSKRLQGVINAQPRLNLERTKANIGTDMRERIKPVNMGEYKSDNGVEEIHTLVPGVTHKTYSGDREFPPIGYPGIAKWVLEGGGNRTKWVCLVAARKSGVERTGDVKPT
nr:hypothetical protein [Tanacetum cinerariifolium]